MAMYLHLAKNIKLSLSTFCTEHGVSCGAGNVLHEMGVIERIQRGQYKWVGDMPSEEMANELVEKTRAYNNKHRPEPTVKSTASLQDSMSSVQLLRIEQKLDLLLAAHTEPHQHCLGVGS